MVIDIIKIFIPATLSFIFGIGLAFILNHYLYKYKMWKKKSGKVALDGKATVIFNELHKEKEVGTPRMGGIIIWLGSCITIIILWLFALMYPDSFAVKLDLLSRNQTWIPLLTLVLGGLVGMVDDLMEIRGVSSHIAGGLSLKKRLVIVGGVALLCALWFYYKLEITGIGLFGGSFLDMGILFIPFFVLITIALYSGGVIDGIDGLAGGIFATMFLAYAGIAFAHNQINLAAFCAVVAGSTLAFLWFNIPPARFYMSETGTMALTITLAVVAFMTDHLGEGHGIIVLPIIAFPLLITSLSVIIQILSKKFRGKKVFLVAPIHHHFEAKGWPSYKVTMRFWVIALMCAVVGMTLGLVG